MSDLAGQKLGQYEIVDQIGRGGMATVYRATQASMNREVAVKVLHKSLLEQDATFLERFRREAQVVAKLQHPHILPVYDFGEHDGQPYLVMALLSGGSLAERIGREGAMPLAEVARILRPVAEALDFAHEQEIIHRDFKPANVMLDGRGYPYLADFGLAKMAQTSQITASAGLIGTPDYMAPDWSKAESVTGAVDIYALGVTLFQMLAGKVPYRASTPMGVLMAHTSEPIPDIRAERPDLPPEIQEVIEAALAKSPEDRFPTATSLVDGLGALVVATTPTQPLPAQTAVVPPAPKEADAFYPNSWARMVLEALEQELGPDNLATVLMAAGAENLIGSMPSANVQRAFSMQTYSRILHTVRQVLGDEEALPLLRRVGRATFESGMQANKVAVRVWEVASRMASPEMRVWLGLETLARMFKSMSDQRVEFENHADHWLWRITNNCPECFDRSIAAPPCEFARAYLEAACGIANVGVHYRVTEIACCASGDPHCTFRVDKTPIES